MLIVLLCLTPIVNKSAENLHETSVPQKAIQISQNMSLAAVVIGVINVNPFEPNEIYKSYQLERSTSSLRVVGWYFSFLFKF